MKTMRTALAALAALVAISPFAQAATSVATASGTIEGIAWPTVTGFLGVPYAAPPVGALRFRAPQPVAPWSGVREAVRFGSVCPQPGSGAGASIGSEDCLDLNLYVPASGGAKLPVMVWIHGGGNVSGAGSDYDGTALAASGDVIVVTLNYRLGWLGFLAHPALSAEASDLGSGDYGLMDQQAALGWVKRNIAAFGGDPANVTVFGESAGGQAVLDHLTSPGAAGLFARAIVQSGSYGFALPTLQNAAATGTTLAASLGCGGGSATAACLRALPPQALVATEAAIAQQNMTSFEPNLRPSILPSEPRAAIASGRFQHVPVLQGTNHDEARLFVAEAFDLVGKPLTASSYAQEIATLTGKFLAPLLQSQYPLSAYASPDIAFSTLGTDSTYACPAIALDDAFAAVVPTWTYEFADEQAGRFVLTDPSMPLAASHASELDFVWPITWLQYSDAERQLVFEMQAAWTNFARSGNPNGPGVPAWAPYSKGSGVVRQLVPGTGGPSTLFQAAHKCGLWRALLALG